MTALVVPTTPIVHRLAQRTGLKHIDFVSNDMSIEDRATLLLIRDLVRLGWHLRSPNHNTNAFEFVAPNTYDKSTVRQAMAYSREEVLAANAGWITKNIALARRNLASGEAALLSTFSPYIEECKSQKSHDTFRIFRYYWSSPYSEYVGRRIKLLIRDAGVPGHPVIGIAALGSSIIHIPDRDIKIGWDTKTRTDRIVYMMDAYVVGALPPYNSLLGGKLISYILASNEVREIFRNKYAQSATLSKQRIANDLVFIITTSLYGAHSSQYNRLRYDDSLLYVPFGETAGYGTLHITGETFNAFRELLKSKNRHVSHQFGDGANWRMRVIREACETLRLNPDTILKHSFKRGLFAVPLASNWKEFLRGEDNEPQYRDLPLESLVEHWKTRWLSMRLRNPEIQQEVLNFRPDHFTI